MQSQVSALCNEERKNYQKISLILVLYSKSRIVIQNFSHGSVKSCGHSQKYISFCISVIQYHQWCINIDLSTVQIVYSPPALGHMVNKVSILTIHHQYKSISSLYQNGPVSPKKQVFEHSQLVTCYMTHHSVTCD